MLMQQPHIFAAATNDEIPFVLGIMESPRTAIFQSKNYPKQKDELKNTQTFIDITLVKKIKIIFCDTLYLENGEFTDPC